MTKKPTDIEIGLTAQEVEASRAAYGKNQVSVQKGKGFWRRFLGNLNDPIIRILIGALIVSTLLLLQDGSFAEVLGIAAAILISTLVSTASEAKSEKAFALLQAQGMAKSCRVVRDGTVCEVPIDEIVVSDIVLLQAGEQVCADGILVQGEVGVNLAALNGESKEQTRRVHQTTQNLTLESENALFRGSAVVAGEGRMQVTAVGDATLYGSLAKELQNERIESPLKSKLSHLARVISRVGYLSAVLVVIADLIYSFFLINAALTPIYVAQNILHALMLGITVIVVCVPEGLPMMITVVLSSNMFRMMKDQVFVRKPIGIETAGGINILFCDKTGTLTYGDMRLDGLLFCDGTYRKSLKTVSLARREVLSLCAWHNTSSDLGEREAVGGNATDRLLLNLCLPYRADAELWVRTAHHPFSSADKYSHATVQKGSQRLTLIKGAPELILPHCASALSESGEIVAFSKKEDCVRRWHTMTQNGMRVLCVALSEAEQDVMQSEMTFVCLLCVCDAVRPQAKRAVAQLHGAGIRLVMITGDHEKTAKAVAQQCGILQNASPLAVLDGTELHKMDDDALRSRLPHLRVICRALPSDKSRLVKVAQQAHLVVGMTGDGLNDAPALKSADVGFAMGSGSDVAKEAADIVILDNNIASIVRAVWYGRTIFQSIRKFILFQLTMNFCAVIVSMLAPFVGADTPITVMQMLWINLMMDTLAGLAFSGEAPDPGTLQKPPITRHTRVLTRDMAVRIVSMGIYCVFLCMGFLKSERVLLWFQNDPKAHMTGFFTLFVFCGIFCAFHARTKSANVGARLWQNHPFLWIMGAVCVTQIAMVYFGGSALRCTSLTPSQLAKTITLSATVLPMEGLRKLLFFALPKRKSKSHGISVQKQDMFS